MYEPITYLDNFPFKLQEKNGFLELFLRLENGKTIFFHKRVLDKTLYNFTLSEDHVINNNWPYMTYKI